MLCHVIYVYTYAMPCYTCMHMLCLANWGRRGRDRMVVGFTTTYAISAYHQ